MKAQSSLASRAILQCVTQLTMCCLFSVFTYLNLLEPAVGVPSLLLGLFPVTLPASVLQKFITLK